MINLIIDAGNGKNRMIRLRFLSNIVINSILSLISELVLPPLRPELLGRHPCVLLEVATEEGLVGEAVFVGDFLERKIGGLQGDFELQHQVVVDDLLGGGGTHLLGDGGQVAGGDAELVGVEGDVALGGAIGIDQNHEFLE